MAGPERQRANHKGAQARAACRKELGVLSKGLPVWGNNGGTRKAQSSIHLSIYSTLGGCQALFQVLGIQQGTKPSPCPPKLTVHLRGTENK